MIVLQRRHTQHTARSPLPDRITGSKTILRLRPQRGAR